MGDGYKGPERVDSSALLPGAQKSISRMQSASDISMAEASAPAWHRNTLDRLKAAGKVREENQAPPRREIYGDIEPPVRKTFITGARVVHKETGKKLTIIQARAGYTKRSHITAHRVADKDGNSWIELETKLKLR